MSYNSDEHNFTFRFHSAEGERDLEMNCNALYVDDVLSFMRDFLQGCGYQIEGTIEVVPYETYEEFEEEQEPKQDKFSMDHLPNNGWPFGMGQSVQSLTTSDIQPLAASQFQAWSADLPSSTGSKIKVQF